MNEDFSLSKISAMKLKDTQQFILYSVLATQ